MADRPTVDRRDGSIVLTLHEREMQVLQWVFSDLGRMLSNGSSVDVVTQRLFPRAYLDPTEEEAETQWQALVHDDLVESRLEAMTDVVRSLDAAVPVAARWRLARDGARRRAGRALDRCPERRPARRRHRVERHRRLDFDALDADDPGYELHALYAWMTELLAALLSASGG